MQLGFIVMISWWLHEVSINNWSYIYAITKSNKKVFYLPWLLRILWAFINSRRYLDCTFRASVALLIYRNYGFTFSKQSAASFGSLWANLVPNTLIGEKEELAFCISVTFLKTFFHSKITCRATNHIFTTTRLFHIYQVVFKFLIFWRSWVANSSYNCCLDMKISYISLSGII